MIGEETRKKAQKLRKDLDTIYDEVADRMGIRITYIQSMNGSIFPCLIDLILGENIDLEKTGIRFLSENDFILPKEIKNWEDEEFKRYIIDNAGEILKNVREAAEEDKKFI